MSRWFWFLCCAVLGLAMLLCGLLVPAHLRAVDEGVLQLAGRNTPALTQAGLALAGERQLGAGELLLQAAQERGVSGTNELAAALTGLAAQHAGWEASGGSDPRLDPLFQAEPSPTRALPFTEFVIRPHNRETVLGFLAASDRTDVQALVRCRSLTNTLIFSPSESASGQALDAAVCTGGLLLADKHLTPGLRNHVFEFALAAGRGASSKPLEELLLDLLSLGQRMNWGQLTAFVSQIDDAETLHGLADLVRQNETKLPVVFSSVQLSGQPAAVARYLQTFSQTGLADLGVSLRYGTGAVNELLRRNQRLFHWSLRERLAGNASVQAFYALALEYAWRQPWLALAVKWVFYLFAGFLLAAALHFGKPAVSVLERPLQVRGFHLAREFLFALGFLLVVLLLSEPFLAQDAQKSDFGLRLRLPTVGSVVAAGNTGAHSTIMNQLSLMTLLLFFVLQGLIYVACLVKLAEIRRQAVPPRIKLKLLENEDHLFDAGLYLGFVGTIISLILVSLGVIKPSLMAAYSSTSFGIIFVSIFKIFHLRPARRKLLLEAETATKDYGARPAAPAYATSA